MKPARRNPFELPGQWLKGGIHLHTTCSDGIRTPEAVVELYGEAGYDFLVFGDHWKITTPVDPAGRVVTIPGAEFDASADQIEFFHFMAVGMRPGHEETLRALRNDPPAMAAALAGSCDLVVLAHPYWSSLTTELCLKVGPVSALEVYNHGCEVDQGTGYSMYVWDQLLSRGRRLDGLAVDDAHFRSHDYCGGWVMVKAAERSPEAILSALKAGEFYSTCGPEIRRVEFAGRRGFRVHTSPARTIMFRCNRVPGVNHAAAPGQSLTAAQWELPEAVQFVRVEVTDSLGRKAWSNPFYL